MDPFTISLLAAGAVKLLGTGVSAIKKNKAQDEKNAWYDYAESFAKSQAQSSVFDTPGGKALLKLTGRNADDNLDAIQNRAAAGGATMENMLAARQANNESRDKVNMQMLQSDERRREGWNQQLLSYKGQRATDNANSYMQAAQDWNQWGTNAAQAILNYGSTGLIGSSAGVAQAPGAANGIAGGTAGYKYAPLAPAVSDLGGLKKVISEA